MYAFGSRVRGDHSGWSDFDILIVVRDKNPEIESGIVDVVVDEEMAEGVNFTPVIKDVRSFKLEEKHHSPFYERVTEEGVLL